MTGGRPTRTRTLQIAVCRLERCIQWPCKTAGLLFRRAWRNATAAHHGQTVRSARRCSSWVHLGSRDGARGRGRSSSIAGHVCPVGSRGPAFASHGGGRVRTREQGSLQQQGCQGAWPRSLDVSVWVTFVRSGVSRVFGLRGWSCSDRDDVRVHERTRGCFGNENVGSVVVVAQRSTAGRDCPIEMRTARADNAAQIRRNPKLFPAWSRGFACNLWTCYGDLRPA